MSLRKKGMLRGLVVVRKVGEQISVNNGEILIEIVDASKSYVKLCFQASREISINRIIPIEVKSEQLAE